MPIYEYECQKCKQIIEFYHPKPDGGPKSIPSLCCGVTALKIVSIPNVAEIASGFKDHPFMMADPETQEMKELDRDHTIMGKPREEESPDVQRLLDIESLKKNDPHKYLYEKGKFHGDILDSDQDGGDVDKKELDTYHKSPGEVQDEERRASPLDYPVTDRDYVKVGEQETKNKKGRVTKRKPILVDKGVLQKKRG